MVYLVEPESKYPYPNKLHENGGSTEKRTCRFAAYAVNETEIVQLIAEYIANGKQYVTAGHDERNRKHFPWCATTVDLPLRIPVHRDFGIWWKLCNGDKGSGHRYRYGGNPEKDYEEFLWGHRIWLSFDDADIIGQVKIGMLRGSYRIIRSQKSKWQAWLTHFQPLLVECQPLISIHSAHR